MCRFVWKLCFLSIVSTSAIAQQPQEGLSDVTAESDKFAQSILPDSAVVYARIAPAEIWLNHPVRKQIQSSEVFQTIWKSKPIQPLRNGIAMVQLAIGDSLESIAKSVSVDGIHVAIDKRTQGIAVLSRTRSERWLKTYLQRVVNLAKSDAASKKGPNPVKEAVYRDVQGFEINHLIVAQLSDWIVVTNKPELAKSMIDRHRDMGVDSLLNSDFFLQASALKKHNVGHPATRFGSDIAYVLVDLDTLRKEGVARELLQSKQRDFGAELILGGAFKVLNETKLATALLSLDSNAIALQLDVPTDSESLCSTHEFFVGPAAEGYARNWIDSDPWLASFSTYRNLSELWLRAGDLFDQNVNDQLAQADNTLTTLFAGKDFATDILGAIEPQLQVLVAPQTFQDAIKPAIRLPSFAVVGKLKDPAKMTREWKRTFQSFAGFLNVAGAMQGQPQLDLNSANEGSAQFHWGEYVIDVDKKYEQGLPIQFNFSPTLGFQGEQIVLSSSIDFAKKVFGPARSETKVDASPSASTANAIATIDIQSLQSLLVDNREQLISQNMLEKGHSQKEASSEVDTLLALLTLMKEATASLTFNETSTLKVRLELQPPASERERADERK
jgi:hypothetical protein